MRRLAAFAILLLALPAALAGCLGGGEEGKATATTGSRLRTTATATGTSGGIQGVVTDEAVQPLPGASVALVEATLTTTVAEDGSFAFSGVRPGDYTLVAAAEGFEGATKTVSVRAEQVANVDFVLVRVASQVPYADLLEFVGFQECATLVGWDFRQEGLPLDDFFLGFSTCSVPNGVLGENTTNDRFDFVWAIRPGVETVVLEMAWASASPLDTHQSITIEAFGLENQWAYALMDVNGTSPIRAERVRADIEAIDARLDERCNSEPGIGETWDPADYCRDYYDGGGEYVSRFFPWFDCFHKDAGFCNNIQLRFELYPSVFYHAPAASGFSVLQG